ncbi:MAG TPA: hypothetical protein VF698_02430 [Thermoanaerobaculia bacterium]|jgi:hypothetical protein
MIVGRSSAWSVLLLAIATLHCAKPLPTSAAPQAGTSRSEASVVVPLCVVVANPGAYDGKRVTVTGCVTTDGREHVALSDFEKPCREGGIVPVDVPTLGAEHQFEAEAGKKVCGTFTGTFRASTVLYDHVLEVEETSNLRTSALQ